MYVNVCVLHLNSLPFSRGGGQGCAPHSKKKLHLSNPHNTWRSHVAVFFHPPFQQHTPQKIKLPRFPISSIHSEFHSYIIIVLIIESHHYSIIMINFLILIMNSHSGLFWLMWYVFFSTSENSINLISVAWCSGRAKVWAARNWLSRSSGVGATTCRGRLDSVEMSLVGKYRMFEDVWEVKFKALSLLEKYDTG